MNKHTTIKSNLVTSIFKYIMLIILIMTLNIVTLNMIIPYILKVILSIVFICVFIKLFKMFCVDDKELMSSGCNNNQ